MVKHIHIIVLEEFKPSHLAKIQLFLGEHILEALMVCEHIYANTIQVMSPNLKCKHHCCKLEVMSQIILLMYLKLSRSISYNLTSLH